MATSSNLSSIIRYYSEKTKSPFIDFHEFCVYIKKYAACHLREEGKLVKYLDNPANTVSAELQGLSEQHLVSVNFFNGKKIIIYLVFFAKKYAKIYEQILNKDDTPFPIISDLPKHFPTQVLERKEINKYITSLIEEKDKDKSECKNENHNVLYLVEFSKEIPALLLPSCITLKTILTVAQQKVRKVLRKDEYHDYFFKKLRNTNPTKKISLQNFYNNFVDGNIFNFKEFSEDDDYYLWNQALYYLTQDFSKIPEKTVDDINILQACKILELHSSYLKQKFQLAREKKEALRELEIALQKPPYFYNMEQILKFQDSNNRLLYGRYSENDLETFLKEKTTETKENELPSILYFKVASNNQYYLYKRNLNKVIIRFCGEANILINNVLSEIWYDSLINFEKLPEMNNNQDFENKLSLLLEEHSPILYGILNASFMSTLASISYEETDNEIKLFENGELLPYSTILELDRERILSNVKLRLPFYYSIPIVFSIISFFVSRIKKLKKTPSAQRKSYLTNNDNYNSTEEKSSRNTAFITKAEEITKEIIPEGSNIDRELDYLIKQWNIMISPDAYNQLIEDVNNLIRDYIRRVISTIPSSNFTKERVVDLARTLVNTPNLKRISARKALTEYVVLYILRLLSNS